jgi:peptide chain release factor 1
MFENCLALEREYADLEQQMSDPALHADPAAARRVGKRHAQLRPVVAAYRQWLQLGEDEAAARELAAEDPEFAAEADASAQERERVAERLTLLLVPRDPMDDKDVILEVKAGEGGQESALFAADLLRMYLRYAERRGWRTEILDSEESDLGGYKDVILEVKAGEGGAESALFAADLLRMYLRYAERRGWRTEILDSEESDLGGYKDVQVAVKARGTVDPGDAPYARLKFEGGVHRVQRVPVTESQGRIHTSAAGVLVLPEAEEVDVQIDPNDLRIDIYRSSGPGGQSVNTTDSAVRITHIPTGIVVSCQNEKSQLQNKESAMRVLRARMLAAAQEAADAEASDVRRSQVRTVDRSERVRTYNYPENRIADHRVNYKSHNLDAVLDGELDDVIDALTDADMAVRIAAS